MTVMQANTERAAPLPRHCPEREPRVFDTIVYEGGGVTLGRFRCDRSHPSFRDTGPIRDAVVVFPRTSVWIRHEGSRKFVADPNVITIYDRGQRYERFPIADAGDHCDWIALSDDLARDVAGSHAPAAAESAERPFKFERAPGSTRLSARQRILGERAANARATALEVEEEGLSIVSAVLALAHARERAATPRRARAAARRRDLAEAARAELARSPYENRSLRDIARALGTSPFHLCRVFREETGRTMHEYRVGIRLRHVMDEIGTRNLSAVAHAAGFASHSHLVGVLRREIGMTPSELRERIVGANR
jgi:AraC-like DNA-binding protein